MKQTPKKMYRDPPVGAVMATITLAIVDVVQHLDSHVSFDSMLLGSTAVSIFLTIRYERWRRRNR